jgi:hypothetical protein
MGSEPALSACLPGVATRPNPVGPLRESQTGGEKRRRTDVGAQRTELSVSPTKAPATQRFHELRPGLRSKVIGGPAGEHKGGPRGPLGVPAGEMRGAAARRSCSRRSGSRRSERPGRAPGRGLAVPAGRRSRRPFAVGQNFLDTSKWYAEAEEEWAASRSRAPRRSCRSCSACSRAR